MPSLKTMLLSYLSGEELCKVVRPGRLEDKEMGQPHPIQLFGNWVLR